MTRVEAERLRDSRTRKRERKRESVRVCVCVKKRPWFPSLWDRQWAGVPQVMQSLAFAALRPQPGRPKPFVCFVVTGASALWIVQYFTAEYYGVLLLSKTPYVRRAQVDDPRHCSQEEPKRKKKKKREEPLREAGNWQGEKGGDTNFE